MIWAAVLVASAGCFALKLAGWSLPARWLAGERLQRAALLLPVALLAALVAVQAFAATADRALVLDARAAGLAVAVLLLALRAPFLLVVVAAAATAALLRAL